MSTRCRIGIQNEDGSIDNIYSHSDGYPAYVGKMLFENYQNPEKIRELMALGDVSILRAEIGEKHPFDEEYEIHPTWTRVYHRDRNDPWQDTKTRTAKSPKGFIRQANNTSGVYAYLFREGKWYFAYLYGDKEFTELTPEVIAKDK